MPKGKPWSLDREKRLRVLVSQGCSVEAIAREFGMSPGAVAMKMNRLGLEVVVARAPITTTSCEDLPTVEQTLLKLAGALEIACQPGLDKVEVQRLQVISTIARTYKEIFADYMEYRKLEVEIVELREKVEALVQRAESDKTR